MESLVGKQKYRNNKENNNIRMNIRIVMEANRKSGMNTTTTTAQQKDDKAED